MHNKVVPLSWFKQGAKSFAIISYKGDPSSGRPIHLNTRYLVPGFQMVSYMTKNTI